jgi:hypothetical protein
MSGTTSRAKAQAQLLHWRDNIFGFEGQLLRWFNDQTFSRIEDFTIITDEEVEDIEYKVDDGDTIAAPRSHRVRLKAAIGYYQYVNYQHLRYGVDILSCTEVVNVDAFDKFFTRDYDPSKPTIRYTQDYIEELEHKKKRMEQEDEMHRVKMDVELKKLANFSSQTTDTAADRFNKGIKRDPSQFKTFQNETYWDTWFRGFTATAKTQGLNNILNEAYVPNTQNDVDLFEAQQAYMYSVLIDRLQTENSQSILRDHEDDKDAQKIIAEVVTYYEKSSMTKNRASTLFSQITSMKIYSTRWNGTVRNFILNWSTKSANIIASQERPIISQIR